MARVGAAVVVNYVTDAIAAEVAVQEITKPGGRAVA
jgi:hypothetical protein